MSRRLRTFWSLLVCGSVLSTGCQPVQPFFFMEDGDLSHYLGMATEIDYPDVEEPCLCETSCATPPLTLRNPDNYEIWSMTLQEVTRITLNNSKVMRQLGGRVASTAPETISRTITSPVAVSTVYDPALTESATGASVASPFGGTGVEAALSAFDAQLDASVFWNKNRTPQNRNDGGFAEDFSPAILAQEIGTFTSGITKVTAPGTQFSIRNNTRYEGNNISSPENPPTVGVPFQAFASAWTTNFEASFSHPFFQGSGTKYNRIAGPFSFNQYASGAVNPIDGVMIARIRTDLSLADFEGGVRNLMGDVENTYWDLYFAFRDLQARKLGRDSSLETWKNVHAKFLTGSRDGSADREAQARSQYFLFRSQVEQAQTELFRAESRLRYIMGLPPSDGKLIRPSDDPTTASIHFDWAEIHTEALVRRVEVRKQKWEVKRRELSLIAARNHLLPRLDAVGTYRWMGLGDELIGPHRSGIPFTSPGSNAFDVMTGGDFQEWQLGLQLSVPIGYRRQISTVRHNELLLARERAVLNNLELEICHQIADAIRDLDLSYGQTQTLFNRALAAEREVQTVHEIYDAGRTTLDQLLDAQRRRAEAESSYYQALVDYNKAISLVHRRKGSALDYNGVYLSEGPWPGRAYFDALRRARQRDASMYLDYGFTMPGIVSRGPYQNGCSNCYTVGEELEIIGEGPEIIGGEIREDKLPDLPEPTKADAIRFTPFPQELPPFDSSQEDFLNEVGLDQADIDSTLEITSAQIAEIGNRLRINAASETFEFWQPNQWQPHHPLMLENPTSEPTTPTGLLDKTSTPITKHESSLDLQPHFPLDDNL